MNYNVKNTCKQVKKTCKKQVGEPKEPLREP